MVKFIRTYTSLACSLQHITNNSRLAGCLFFFLLGLLARSITLDAEAVVVLLLLGGGVLGSSPFFQSAGGGKSQNVCNRHILFPPFHAFPLQMQYLVGVIPMPGDLGESTDELEASSSSSTPSNVLLVLLAAAAAVSGVMASASAILIFQVINMR